MELTASKEYLLEDLSVTAGNRAYIVGTQNGRFPPFGRHIPGEMGGFWTNKVKLLNGFKILVGESEESLKEIGNSVKFTTNGYSSLFRYREGDLTIERRQFCPDNLEAFVLELNLTSETQLPPYCALELDIKFVPSWLSEKTGVEAGDVVVQEEGDNLLFADSKNRWYLSFGSTDLFNRSASPVKERQTPLFFKQTVDHRGKPVNEEIALKESLIERVTIKLPQNSDSHKIIFFFAGDTLSEESAAAKLAMLKEEYPGLLASKRERLNALFDRSSLKTPNERINLALNWAKINNDWLTHYDPLYGNGLLGGIPDYPWWFSCDSSYAVYGSCALGDTETILNTLRLIKAISESENGNGRVIHEAARCHSVYNRGNSQETPHFVLAVWELFKWTGDREFLAEFYPFCLKGLSWLINEMCSCGNLYPSGYGIVELSGFDFKLVDTAFYSCESFKVVAQMAKILGDKESETLYEERYRKTFSKIVEDYWVEEESLFGDLRATPNQIVATLPGLVKRYEAVVGGEFSHLLDTLSQVEERAKKLITNSQGDCELPWVLHRNAVNLVPLKLGYATDEQAKRVLKRYSTIEFLGDGGTYLSGLERRDKMTISTASHAVAAGTYREAEILTERVETIASTLGLEMPGSMSEMSPKGGCIVQAWTIYGLIWPLVTFVLGLKPNAYEKSISLTPNLPKKWDFIELTNLKIADTTVSVSIRVTDFESCVDISLPDTWKLLFNPHNFGSDKIILNGRDVTTQYPRRAYS